MYLELYFMIVYAGFWAELEIKLAFLLHGSKFQSRNPKMPENDEFYQSLRPTMV